MSHIPYLLVGWSIAFCSPLVGVFCNERTNMALLSAMEGSLNKRLREREATPPPAAKKRCTQATPPATASSSKSNGSSSNGHDATHTELESLGRNGSARRSSRSSATSSTTSSPPASPARRGRRGGAGGASEQPQTPTRTSGRLRQSYHLSFETVLHVHCHQLLPTRFQMYQIK